MIACACRQLHRLQFGVNSNLQALLVANYKSKVSLDNLYPSSDHSEEAYVKPKVPEFKSDGEGFTGVIPLKEIQIQSCRASGPGGQHVNKVNTKVEVRFNIDSAVWIPEWIKPKLKEQQPGRINKVGELIVSSDKTRKQILNQADCLEKIRHMIFQASVKPKELTPEEIELQKKREEAFKKRNIEDKRRKSMLKQQRQRLGSY